jgi:alkylation response protein AidB-like acyl-CoA dehydrogenase
MYLEFSDEQRAFGDAVRAFGAARAPLSYVRAMYDDDRGTTDEVWRGLVDLGVTAALVPERAGGLGAGMVDIGLGLEALGRALHPGPYLASAVAATLLITALDDGAEDELLSAMATGRHVAVPAVFEPERRHDWHQPQTTATLTTSGWTVSGTKVHVGDARAADTILVLAADDQGLGLFAVPRVDAEVVAEPVLDGSKKQATVTQRAVPARRIGRSDATTALAGALDRIAIAVAAEAVGSADAALAMAVDYANLRHQFGRPIGSFQAVQQLCVDMHSEVENARSLVHSALWAADDVDELELHRAATMAKAYASDAVARVGERAIQVHGGIGVTWDHDVGLFYKRGLWAQSAYGDARAHYEELARLLLPPSSDTVPAPRR